MGSTTLPSFLKAVDQAFVTTWYEIRAQAIDNILKATPLWAALSEKGVLKPQEGGNTIEETIRYDNPEAIAVAKGYIFAANEPETDTAAFWTFRNLGQNIVRSYYDDAENRGKFRIKDYIADRIGKARKAFPQKMERALLGVEVTAETGIQPQSLRDILPSPTNRTVGTFGKISRPSNFVYESTVVLNDNTSGMVAGQTQTATSYTSAQTGQGVEIPDINGTNAFWGGKYLKLNLPYSLNLEADLKTLFNSCQNNQEACDLIVMTKALIEVYEEFASDRTQIVTKEGGSDLASLGFITFKYKGADMIWSPNMVVGNLMLLNTNSFEIVYDPMLWFEMTPWKPLPNSDASYAQIVAKYGMRLKEARRNGRAYTTDSDL